MTYLRLTGRDDNHIDLVERYCKEQGLPVHPARFPDALPEYFIRMLTDPGDMVLDPFAGSCVTGEVASRLDRQWKCCELDEDFLKGAVGRFQGQGPVVRSGKAYSIYPPCSLPVYDATPLPEDGGASRPAPSPPQVVKAPPAEVRAPLKRAVG